MKKFTFFTFVLTAISSCALFAQEPMPSFTPPIIKEGANTNSPKRSSNPELVAQDRTNMVKRLLNLYNKVKEEQRVAANAAATNLVKAAQESSTNQPTNAVANTAKPKREKNPPPPVFIAKDSVTNYVVPPKDTNIFLYSQRVWIPRTPEEMEVRKHAIARLMGLEQGVWGYTGPVQGTPNKSPEYVVNQSPLAPLPNASAGTLAPDYYYWQPGPPYRREYYINRPNYGYYGFQFDAVWASRPYYYDRGWSVRRHHNHHVVRRPIRFGSSPSTRANLSGERRPGGGQVPGRSQALGGGGFPSGGQSPHVNRIPAGGQRPNGGQQPRSSQAQAGGGQRPGGGQLPRVSQGMGAGGQRPTGGGQGIR